MSLMHFIVARSPCETSVYAHRATAAILLSPSSTIEPVNMFNFSR